MSAHLDAHPAANLFPLLEGPEFEALVDDIRQHGLREPVVLDEHDRILDGRNRYRACAVLGIEPAAKRFDGTDAEALAYVVSLNLMRRHLSESQRAMVAARLANLNRGDNQHTAIAATSQGEAARLLNVSPDSIQRARVVQRDGVPELIEAVERGDVAVSKAAQIARSLPKSSASSRRPPSAPPIVASTSGTRRASTSSGPAKSSAESTSTLHPANSPSSGSARADITPLRTTA
jgi:ParB-like chromosome segregation protein Spo0J